MSEHERLHKTIIERDIARLRLKKARGALYRIINLHRDEEEPFHHFLERLKHVAKSGCGTPKKRKKPGLPGQIDLEEWLNDRGT